MSKPFNNFTNHLERDKDGSILLNGTALRHKEIIKVFIMVDGRERMFSAQAWEFVSKKYPNGVFVLKGSYPKEHFEKIRARRLIKGEFDFLMVSQERFGRRTEGKK